MEPERGQDGEGFGNRDGGLDMGIDVVGSKVNVLDRIIPCVRVAVVVDVIVVTEAGVDAFGGEVAVVGVVVSGFEVGGDDEVVPVVHRVGTHAVPRSSEGVADIVAGIYDVVTAYLGCVVFHMPYIDGFESGFPLEGRYVEFDTQPYGTVAPGVGEAIEVGSVVPRCQCVESFGEMGLSRVLLDGLVAGVDVESYRRTVEESV